MFMKVVPSNPALIDATVWTECLGAVGRELLISECLQGTEKAEHYRYLIERFERKIALYKRHIGE